MGGLSGKIAARYTHSEPAPQPSVTLLGQVFFFCKVDGELLCVPHRVGFEARIT